MWCIICNSKNRYRSVRKGTLWKFTRPRFPHARELLTGFFFLFAKTEIYCNLSTHSSFGQNLATMTDMPFVRIRTKVRGTHCHSENVDPVTQSYRTYRKHQKCKWIQLANLVREMGKDVLLWQGARRRVGEEVKLCNMAVANWSVGKVLKKRKLKLYWKHLTLRRLMSYIYGAPILDVSRSHTTTQHSR